FASLALPGTRGGVAVARAEAEVDAAGLAVEWTEGGTQTIPLTLDGATAGGGFTLRGEGAYRIRLVGEGGRENADPVRYTLATLRDAPPQITLLEGHEGALSDAARTAQIGRAS